MKGRFLHRDFHPGNVLFDMPPARPANGRITGVVDWAATSWGPTDLDVAHCSASLALLHGQAWVCGSQREYEEAGGALAAAASERLYWRVRDGPAFSDEVQLVSQPWREAGRTGVTTRSVQARLDAYVTALTARRGVPADHRPGVGRVRGALRETQGRTRRPRPPLWHPCSHEHACIRCPMLQVDPTMLPRLDELEADLLARRDRAQQEGWLGEIEGLDLTFSYLRQKRKDARRPVRAGPVEIGMPGAVTAGPAEVGSGDVRAAGDGP